MKHVSFVISLPVLFSLALSGQAQSYKIQVREFPEEGTKVLHKSIQKTKEEFKVSLMEMVVKEESKSQTQEKISTFTVLEKGERAPKKYQKTFTKAVTIKDDKETPFPYQGRTIIYEMKDGKYEARAEGEPALPEDELKKLTDAANNELNTRLTQVFLPGKEVKAGDTWTIDPAKAGKMFGAALPIDADKSSGQGKLVKAYKKGTHQFGTLEFDLKLMVTALGPAKLESPIPFNLNITLDTAIDGSTSQGTMQMKGDLKGKTDLMQGGQTITIDLNLTMSGSTDQSELKDGK